MKNLILIFGILLVTPSLKAAPIEKLVSFIEEQTAVAQMTMNDSQLQGESLYSYLLKRVYLRMRGKAGFEVPFLAKLEFVPEVELIWEKQ